MRTERTVQDLLIITGVRKGLMQIDIQNRGQPDQTVQQVAQGQVQDHQGGRVHH